MFNWETGETYNQIKITIAIKFNYLFSAQERSGKFYKLDRFMVFKVP